MESVHAREPHEFIPGIVFFQAKLALDNVSMLRRIVLFPWKVIGQMCPLALHDGFLKRLLPDDLVKATSSWMSWPPSTAQEIVGRMAVATLPAMKSYQLAHCYVDHLLAGGARSLDSALWWRFGWNVCAAHVALHHKLRWCSRS